MEPHKQFQTPEDDPAGLSLCVGQLPKSPAAAAGTGVAQSHLTPHSGTPMALLSLTWLHPFPTWLPSLPNLTKASGAALPLARGCQQFAECVSQPRIRRKDVCVTLGKRRAQREYCRSWWSRGSHVSPDLCPQLRIIKGQLPI